MHVKSDKIKRAVRVGFTIRDANHIASCSTCYKEMKKWKFLSWRR